MPTSNIYAFVFHMYLDIIENGVGDLLLHQILSLLAIPFKIGSCLALMHLYIDSNNAFYIRFHFVQWKLSTWCNAILLVEHIKPMALIKHASNIYCIGLQVIGR